MNYLQDARQHVLQQIQTAEHVQRAPETVQLLAVSKHIQVKVCVKCMQQGKEHLAKTICKKL